MRSDGQPIVVSLTISPIRDEAGNVVAASKIVRDVTLKREAEERERKLLADAASANAKFRAFFDQGAVFAGIMDLDGTVIDANRRWWEGSGFAREDVIGRKFWDGPVVKPSPTLAATIRAATSTPRPASRSAPSSPTSPATAASASPTSRSCRSAMRRGASCSSRRPAPTSPPASAPRTSASAS
jgi:hypothetical protein